MKTWSGPWEEVGPVPGTHWDTNPGASGGAGGSLLRLMVLSPFALKESVLLLIHTDRPDASICSPSSKPAASFPVSVNFLSSWTSCPLWPRLMRFYVIDLWLKLRFTLKVWSCKHSKTIWIHVVTRNNRHAVLLLQAFIIFMDQLVNFSETFIILTCVALIKVCCFERNVTQTADQTYKKIPWNWNRKETENRENREVKLKKNPKK